MLLAATAVEAQILIGGNVYGGARQANVGGSTFVHVGADNHDVLITAVYGGNDISGTIGASEDIPTTSGITDALANKVTETAGENTKEYNTFVRISPEKTQTTGTVTTQLHHIFIGNVFGGSNGEYDYTKITTGANAGKYKVTEKKENPTDPEVVVAEAVDKAPEVGKTYLEIKGGTVAFVYTGGNNATVTGSADICIDNESDVTKEIKDGTTAINYLNDQERINEAGLATIGLMKILEGNYHFFRVFGGNNMASMHITPTWHLNKGKIENLYSGGNRGSMTSPVGLILDIDPKVPASITDEAAIEAEKKKLKIENVYGGCRMADVIPQDDDGDEITNSDLIVLDEKDETGELKYKIPPGLSARVVVRGGDINNVYGGNDITGNVKGGNAVGVHTSIRGTIYGGGNGSYPYTDNPALKNSLVYGDYYYGDFMTEKGYTSSVKALNAFRPNAEQVSIRVAGKAVGEGENRVITPTVIGGGIYVGGNSASLKATNKENPIVHLKVGSHVITENVFLGNNGEYMVKSDDANESLQLYAKYVDADGDFVESTATGATKFTSLEMTDATTFAEYMDGCALSQKTEVVFDGDDPNDPGVYEEYSSYFGSFFCGGNVGSMTMPGKTTIDFKHKIIVYDKVVGGCNNAYVNETAYNAAYRGGIIGSSTEWDANDLYTDNSGKIKDRVELKFNGLKIQPMRLPIAGVDDNAKQPYSHIPLVWNTIKLGERDANGKPVPVAWDDDTWAGETGDSDEQKLIKSTMDRRFDGGNIYGGCCTSGVVNGNVLINIESTIVNRDLIFDKVETDDDTGEDVLYSNTNKILEKHTGVILGRQGMDVLGSALNVFGGGKGVETEIWGSATVNLNKGYVFQIFGGSEQGAIGRRKTTTTGGVTSDDKDAYGRYVYEYNDKYSTYVNLSGLSNKPGVSKASEKTTGVDEDLAEVEFIYGGGFEGAIAGNTRINLDNGRIFNSFAGSCNADIQGHTETYIGANGFPYVRDYVYGGNDLGGKILGTANFQSRVRDDDNDATNGNGTLEKVHGYDASKSYKSVVLNASAYIEYNQGRVGKIFGGCYGVYDYTDPLFGKYFYAEGATDTNDSNKGKARTSEGYSKPFLDNAFINFRPTVNSSNEVGQIFGAGQGYFMEKEENLMQNRSYILVDVPSDDQHYQSTEIFGAGECGGVGMGVRQTAAATPDGTSVAENPNNASAIIDLVRGHFKAVYGGSYQEGITRRTVVNVPEGSTFRVNKIFGGAYGRIDVEKTAKTDPVTNEVLKDENDNVLYDIKETPRIDVACDVYESNVNWNSEDAIVDEAIYGGNNACRRTLYGKVNITAPTTGGTHWTGVVNVYGAGYGVNTWSQYTEVNLEKGARVQEAYGGGENGQVLNTASVAKWKTTLGQDTNGKDKLYTDLDNYTDEGLSSTLANSNRLHEVDPTRPEKYNCNVHIKEGATVARYCYGGGLGHGDIPNSGDVYGTTYIDLLGGTVDFDLYAAGTSGSVKDGYGVKGGFVASSNAYIEGGKARNVYGGGWAGTVGHHAGSISASYADDIYGETHVVIGILEDNLPANPKSSGDEGYDKDWAFHHGIPVVERNAYAGGEGGAVFGTANITMNNGYIGYRYFSDKTDDDETTTIDERYEEKIDDETNEKKRNTLYNSGSIYGGGYIDNSSVDVSNVVMYGGHVRNALFGGGEIAAIGRGVINAYGEDNSIRELKGIYKAGKTNVTLYDGYVHRNVFGGGRGYNFEGEGGNLYSDGYVFGQTEVHIYGGEVGTAKELEAGNGNVFGGGDIGYVYSAYENQSGALCIGKKDGERYDDEWEGYYYEIEGGAYNDNGEYTGGTWVMDGSEYVLTEDCKVLVEPHCKVTDAGGIEIDVHYRKDDFVPTDILALLRKDANYEVDKDANGKEIIKSGENVIVRDGIVEAASGITVSGTFGKGQYVPTSFLNSFKNKNEDKTRWDKLDVKGIIIYNAVFAGGNTSVGNAEVYANATTVFGNATASIHDCYHRDLITVGTGHTGGLYGDGNLTFVDGYRGLNITNYGTDYYTIEGTPEITLAQYKALDAREAAYYELRYKCIKACTDKQGTHYTPGATDASGSSKASTLSADDLLALFTYDDGTSVKEGDDKIIVTNDKGEKVPNPAYWQENGVCTIYAGRIMNTIQRADFCGVFGSRMVMQGARDRVPETVDYTNYTINRVREVSLNQQHSVISSDLTAYSGSNDDERILNEGYANVKKAIHGNYFGIYNIVNFLGALTSDQHFTDKRVTENTTGSDKKDPVVIDETSYAYGTATYYNWKQAHKGDGLRNNGRSQNKVALASGVYLELTTEKSTGKEIDEKDWGYITGVVELDLINVQEGIGGGFVYAKNEHRTCTYSKKNHSTLTALNRDAITRKNFDYTHEEGTGDAKHVVDNGMVEWETSGNFVHSTQTIIDDCYNKSGKYSGDDAVPAHYWFIKGQVYIYDQYISAYTGAPNAYSETVDIPLTITAASHGTMKLMDVKPCKYAYYSAPGVALTKDQKIVINEVTYNQNDPISYWDWSLLGAAKKQLFVDETYITAFKCTIGTDEVPAGTIMLPGNTNGSDEGTYYWWKKKAEDTSVTPSVYTVTNEKNETVDFDFVFRPSNNLAHNTGYILTYKVNNPTEWDSWYTKYESATHEKQQTEYSEACNKGPTYRLKGSTGGVLGQREYKVGELIPEDIYYTYEGKSGDSNYPGIRGNITAANGTQAEFEAAYIVTKQIDVEDPVTHDVNHLNPGSTMSATDAASHTGSVDAAYICTSTVQISKTEFIYLNAKMTSTAKQDYITLVNQRIGEILTGANISKTAESITKMSDLTNEEKAKLTDANKTKLSSLLNAKADINANVVPAYYCTSEGNYGGNYYQSGLNYRGLAAWCSMSEQDRAQFEFNYDALDLLIEPTYNLDAEGMKYHYDGNYTTEEQVKDTSTGNKASYSLTRPVDYTATYNSNVNLSLTNGIEVIGQTGTQTTIYKDNEITRTAFETIPNEQRHYVPIKMNDQGACYVVIDPSLQIGNTPYAVGKTTTKEIYEANPGKIAKVEGDPGQTYYFCRESYEIGHLGDGQPVKSVADTKKKVGETESTFVAKDQTLSSGTVPVGFVIGKGAGNSEIYCYNSLVNKQTNFTIHGIAPTETSTLFVSRESDIFNLSAKKIITVVYRYDYEEGSADEITPVSERHVVNIHIEFKSGIPTIEDIKAPPTIIPGDKLGLLEPFVSPGAYEVTGGGWKLFETADDAESHTNGIEYIPNSHPLYWYQDGYYLAYYAKTFLGETYSNSVPVSVANYHDLKKVMSDEAKTHHYYVDYPSVKRNSKIYIKDSEEGLNQLKNLFNLSKLTLDPSDIDNKGIIKSGDFAGHHTLDEHVKECENLDFILATNIEQTGDWEPIAGEKDQNGKYTSCFTGTLHGDGYYISGLTSSLFGKLCGNVYNLGVTGSFTGAGVAETGGGYMENCWISTTGTPDGSVRAVFGEPTASDGFKIVNCYYPQTKNYNTTDNGRGLAIPMPEAAFYNGTVAYNLNGFYLYKRYCDQKVSSGTASYKYFTVNSADNSLKLHDGSSGEKKLGYYGSNPSYSSAGITDSYFYNGYVEDRYGDGDFRYAGGEVPDTEDERGYTEGVNTKFAPIWPDDYLYFGQMLTYRWNELRPHEDVPSHLFKTSGRLATTDQNNRVYRAPAYFRDNVMDVAHFNPSVNLVAYSKPKNAADTDLRAAYPKMTAIDFAGHNDVDLDYQLGTFAATPTAKAKFYPPLLDDDGIQSIANLDETPNLLVYAPASGTTYDKLVAYFIGTDDNKKEPVYSEYDETSGQYSDGKNYNRVYTAPSDKVVGHLVTNNFKTLTDHLLVDKQDFNCPISYDMGDGFRIWYQRKPDSYVDVSWSSDATPQRTTTGWESISLPFTAELVTTHQKGEITHFYNGTNADGSSNGVGHEYWLRECTDITKSGTDIATANFTYLAAAGSDKEMMNSFLWDYYYEANVAHGHNTLDANRDVYQEYYKPDGTTGIVNTFKSYPLLTQGTPYLIGFPGTTYYEFDLSGGWTAKNTLGDRELDIDAPAQLAKQTISFVSATGATIAVSTSELENNAVSKDGYYFKPNYLNIDVPDNGYIMASDGGSYEKVTSSTDANKKKLSAFRTYFQANKEVVKAPTRSIRFNNVSSQFGGEDQEQRDHVSESMEFSAKKHAIVVTSHMQAEADVSIFTVSGVCVASFNIAPDETIETPISNSGVYIVRASGGHYTHKVTIK